LNPDRMRALAKSGLTVEQAEAELKLSPGVLGALLAERKKAGAAWRRGETLFILGDLAVKGSSPAEVAAALEITEADLQKKLTTDPELASIWSRGRAAIRRDIRQALLDAAKNGKIGPIERLLTELAEVQPDGFDVHAVSQKQIVEVFGVTRGTVHNWGREDPPMPRNADGTYPLPEVVKWWHLFQLTKTGGTHSKNDSQELLRQERRESIRLANAQKRGELLNRREVMLGMIGRVQIVATAMAAKPAVWAPMFQGKPAAAIREILEEEIPLVLREMTDRKVELKLTGEEQDIFNKLIRKLVDRILKMAPVA